jgi:hypothetical protein
MFECRLDRRKYHEEFWEIYNSHMKQEAFETQDELNAEILRCSVEAFNEFSERYPAERLDYYDWWALMYQAQTEPTECPTCGELQQKALYMGLPGKLCKDPKCATLTGPAEWAAGIFFDGKVFFYTGSYWLALWDFLTKDDFPDPIDYN